MMWPIKFGAHSKKSKSAFGFRTGLLLCLLAGGPSGLWAEASPGSSGAYRIVKETVNTGFSGFPEIFLVLRLPEDHSADDEPLRVFGYCYHYGEQGSVEARALDGNFLWNRFAKDHGLAALTWNTATLWRSRRSHDQLDRWDYIGHSRNFATVAKAWERGFLKLAKEHNLEPSDLLLYGASRGAHFALRLAMQQGSRRFKAVHVHVPNSFDKPSQIAKDTVWVVSNGDWDVGTQNAMRFVSEAERVGLPVMLRFFRGLGHGENAASQEFSRRFFEYVLTAGGRDQDLAATIRDELKSPAFVADLHNETVVPAAMADRVPEPHRIPVPNENLPPLWGRILR